VADFVDASVMGVLSEPGARSDPPEFSW